MKNTSSSARSLTIVLSIIGLSTAIAGTAYYYKFSNEPEKTEIKNIISPVIPTPPPTKPLLKTPAAHEALTALFSITTSSNQLKTSENKLASLWFEKSFNEGEDKYHVIFIKNQIVDESNEVYGSHADAPVISAVVYKLEAEKWTLVSKQKEIGVFGSWGDAPEVEDIQPLQLAKGHTAFLLDIAYSGQGYTNSGKTIFSYRDKQWSIRGYLQTGGDNSGVCDDEAKEDEFLSACWQFDGKVTLAENSKNSDYPDLQVSRSGTMSDENGNIIPVSNSVYSFNGEEYLEAESE